MTVPEHVTPSRDNPVQQHEGVHGASHNEEGDRAMSAQLEEIPAKWPLPKPCFRCSWDGDGVLTPQYEADGRLARIGLTCGACGLHVKWVPKRDLGLAPDNKRTRPEISPSKRARILAAFNHICVSCKRDDRPLEIGHLISIADGHQYGLTDDELFDDFNLVPMCDACNAGQGDMTVGMWLIVKSLRIHIAKRDGKA